MYGFFQNSVIGWAYTVPLVLIVLDFVTGVLAAIHKKVFAWNKLSGCLGKDGVQYLVTIAVVFVAQVFKAPELLLQIGSSATLLLLATSVCASILSNIQEMGASPAILAEVLPLEQYILRYLPGAGAMVTVTKPAPTNIAVPLIKPLASGIPPTAPPT